MQHPLIDYLADCRARHRTGAVTPETSYYGPLEALLNAVGKKLKKPKVRCFMSLGNTDGNMPDGGLFTPDQIQRGDDQPTPGQKPSRGVIEAKPLATDITKLAAGTQVARYWNQHQQVLVTNFREFALIGRDENDRPVRHEFYRLADSEAAFWQLAAHPEQAVREHGERLLQFLERCLRRPADLTDPKDVAWFLASYARDARNRVEHSQAHRQVEVVRKALEQSLGLRVEDEKGEHFFQSTLVQTLFYGLFSAWVLWHRTGPAPGERFDPDKASRYLHVPILRKLFRELTDPSHLDEWDNLTEVMGWAADTLNRVVREVFFQKFREAEAVQYFYEPFLEAFDPELRKQLGVWYTPPEIVKYMVARVDQVLKSDFQKPDGLADEEVYILDPCCGTGAYLVETLSVIANTLAEQGEGATLAGKLKKAASERVFGFEILPAPFVVAHLQLGLFLQGHGAAFNDKKHERAAVYLTNALTGWTPPAGPKQKLTFPEMEEERDAADKIKQSAPILVVLGNPPYNGFAGVPAEEEAGLVAPYRETKRAPKPQGQGLNDLYVRFFRVAERCITERGVQHGIVCYISNYSWLDGLSHTGMRERFLEEFDEVWIDSLNGDKYKTGKTTPEGKPDPSVFSTPQSREGIQVGTAVALLSRKPTHQAPATVHFRDWWGEAKREELLKSVTAKRHDATQVTPVEALGLPFRPMQTVENYATWPLLTDLFPSSFPGVKTSRDEDLVAMQKEDVEHRMRCYFDPTKSMEELSAICPRLVKNATRFDAQSVRATLLKRGMLSDNVVRYDYRPFDRRWLYWEPQTKLLDEKRSELFDQVANGNIFLFTTGRTRKDQIEPATVSTVLTDLNLMDSGARAFPMLTRKAASDLYDEDRGIEFEPNLTSKASAYLSALRCPTDVLLYHALAILHSYAYRSENFSGLKSDWPRVPLPDDRKSLGVSANLGLRIAALLDPETPVKGVTAGKPPAALAVMGVPTRVGGGNFTDEDYAVTARWGIAGKGGVTMPAKGRVEKRPFSAEELAAFGDAVVTLGDATCDIYLNDNAYWRNVPLPVWEYTLGGYQVLKKWLSYREQSLLGRPLTVDEVTYVRDVIRRIAALLLLGPELDANYAAVKAAPYPWPACPAKF
jgi:hypothetical protein